MPFQSKDAQAKYYAANREKIVAKRKADRDAKVLAEEGRVVVRRKARVVGSRIPREVFYDEKKEKYQKLAREWQQNNKGKVAYYAAKRRCNQLQATPKWANEFFIEEAYELAVLRTKMTGVKWHVDHIVPLQGKTVCGLHVENNLQVILAVENLKKKNKH